MQPTFIDGPGGRLFVLHHCPSSGARDACLVVVPAFAEEMNKCRSQVALQARALRERGVGTVVMDLGGTGESDGEFSDASVERWVDEIACVMAWARDSGYAVIDLLAVRSGALLLAPLVAKATPWRNTVLWQPMASGKLLVNQFLRLKVAAGMMAGGEGVTVKDLRAGLSGGRSVEVSGYELGPALVAGLDGLELAALAGSVAGDIEWLDIARADQPPPPATRRLLETFASAGANVRHHACTGEPFWGTAEIATAPEMVALTTDALVGAP